MTEVREATALQAELLAAIPEDVLAEVGQQKIWPSNDGRVVVESEIVLTPDDGTCELAIDAGAGDPDIEPLKNCNEELRTQIEALEGDIAQRDERIEQLEDALDERAAKVTELREEAELLEERLDTARDAIDVLVDLNDLVASDGADEPDQEASPEPTSEPDREGGQEDTREPPEDPETDQGDDVEVESSGAELDHTDLDDVVRAYVEADSFTGMGSRFDVSHATVRHILVEEGIHTEGRVADAGVEEVIERAGREVVPDDLLPDGGDGQGDAEASDHGGDTEAEADAETVIVRGAGNRTSRWHVDEGCPKVAEMDNPAERELSEVDHLEPCDVCAPDRAGPFESVNPDHGIEWLARPADAIVADVNRLRRDLEDVLDAVENADDLLDAHQRLGLTGINQTKELLWELGLRDQSEMLLPVEERRERIEQLRETFVEGDQATVADGGDA